MKRSLYGVTKAEVDKFVEENRAVRDWLSKYEWHTEYVYGRVLCRFFKWLRMVEDPDLGLPIQLSARELLNEQIILRKSNRIEDRRKHLRRVLKFSRDNPDFRELSDGWKYVMYIVIKNFYDFHEVPLTTDQGVFGKRNSRKRRKQITLADVKQVLGTLQQRERTILLIMLQSGMEIGAVLNKFSWMWPQIKPQLYPGAQRVKVEFDDRKGNNFSYFTYFSKDAIQELRKWLIQRRHIVKSLQEQGKSIPESVLGGQPIFVTNFGTPYTPNNFYSIIYYYQTRCRGRLKNFVSHQFRKLFKTEASLPERGIDRDVVEFMMGHANSIGSVGGTYDKTPEIHEEVIENEYCKLEKYLNIYSMPPREILTHREMEQQDIERFTDKLLKDPRFLEGILDFLGENMNMVRPDGSSVPLKTVATPKGIMLQRPESHKLEKAKK